MPPHDPDITKLDDLTARRLAKLSQAPVDTRALQERIQAAWAAEQHRAAASFSSRWSFRAHHLAKVWGSLAAALAIVGLVGWLMLAGSSPAQAAPLAFSRLHKSLLSGQDVAQVISIQEANDMIAQQQQGLPRLPREIGPAVRGCCVQDVQGVIVACVVMEHQGQPVTLVVARGKDLCSMMGQQLTSHGRHLVAHEVEGVRMVMGNEGDHWLCVMGDLPTETLAEIAASVKF
ncbi:MAG: hypothetical protein IT443_02020 [Phycisphaeraceae bacterium]|nr:hypothetical protein [Phycisphaeraceae bacterium]